MRRVSSRYRPSAPPWRAETAQRGACTKRNGGLLGPHRTRRGKALGKAFCLLLSALTAVWVATMATAAVADKPLPKPAGRVLLTVTGAIDHTNADGRAEFDRQMLEALGVTALKTSTTWTDGTPLFEGVLGRDILGAVGAEGVTVRAIALNDYDIDIPISDFDRYRVLFALKMDGVELTARDKGPIWIVYPRDDHKELQTEKLDWKWIWQLIRLEVK